MRFLGALFLLAIAPGAWAAFWGSGAALVHASCLWPLLVGFALGLVLDHVLFHKVPGLETFEHELTHAIAALMFFRRVTGFSVTRHRGGYCVHTGGFGGRLGDDFITMAPYVLPTFTFLSVMIRPLLPAGVFPWFDVWIGLTFGYHILSNLREVRQSWSRNWFVSSSGEYAQTDLGKSGLVFSFLYIPVVSLAILGLMAAVLAGGYRGIAVWATVFWRAEVLAVTWVNHRLVELLRRR